MGSLPNVKKSKKSPVHQVKKLLLEAENCKETMGNLCSMGASAAAKKVKKYYIPPTTAMMQCPYNQILSRSS